MCRTLYTVLYVAHLRMLVERYDIVYSRPEPFHSRVHLTMTNIPTALYKPWPLPLPFSKSKVSKCSVCCALSYIPTIQIWYFDVIAKGHELSSHITPSELTVYVYIPSHCLVVQCGGQSGGRRLCESESDSPPLSPSVDQPGEHWGIYRNNTGCWW